MGKSAPQPPAAPDPNVVSAAQTQSNEATAKFQSQLNNGNSYSPYGSVTNTYNPSTNQWTQNTSFSPVEQQIFDQGTQAQVGALGVANQQIGRVSDALGSSVAPPTLATGVQGGQIAGGYGNGGQIAYGFGQGQPIQGQVGSTPVQMNFGQGQPIQTQVGSGAPVQYGYGSGGPIQQGVQTNGLQSGYDHGGSIQGQVSPYGQVTNSYGQGQPLQGTYGNGGPVQYGIGSQDINQSVQNAANAAYGQATSRLDPQWQQASEQQNAQLIAQGLNPNDAAWKNSMTLFDNARNDAYNQANFSAIGAGNQEQNTLFGQQQAQGQFYNAAQAQANAQNQGAAGFWNQTQGQQTAQNAAQAAFQNSAQAQGYGQNLSSGQFANSAQAQANAQNAAQGAFYNQAQLSGFGENLQAGQFGNAAQAQGNSQNAAALAAYNAAQAQQFGQGVTQGQFANQAAGQQFSQGLQGQQAFNAASGQLFNQGLQQGQFGNQAAAQQYAQNQGQAAFNNAAQGQANSQNQAAASFANTAQQQGYDQNMANANLWNSAAQSNFQNENYAQQLPINELSALLGMGQTQLPQGYSGAQTSVAPTDVLGAYGLQQSALQNTYDAQMKNYQSSMGGLFNLGSAGLSALSTFLPFSDVRLKRDIVPAGTWRGHNVYSFRYAWDRDEDPPHVGVIAQEVAQTHPHAVGQRDGYLTVDYGAL